MTVLTAFRPRYKLREVVRLLGVETPVQSHTTSGSTAARVRYVRCREIERAVLGKVRRVLSGASEDRDIHSHQFMFDGRPLLLSTHTQQAQLLDLNQNGATARACFRHGASS